MIYVWRNDRVLRNYGPGIAIVQATSIEEAWDKLANTCADVFWYLKTGRRGSFYDESIHTEHSKVIIELYEEENEGIDNPQPGYPVTPEEFDPENLPVIYLWGSE